MSPEEFVSCVAREKDDIHAMSLDHNSGSATAVLFNSLNLTTEQKTILTKALDGVLTDAYYSFLLALDGAGSLGGLQTDYELKDEDGNLLSRGELEGPAWERFHGESID